MTEEQTDVPLVRVADSVHVCQQFDLEIVRRWSDKDHEGVTQPPGSVIKPVPAPSGRVAADELVRFLLKPDSTATRIEHLGRTEFVDLDGWEMLDFIHFPSRFFATVHTCFAEHFGLALSADVLMYLISHEVATCVKLHPERYRDLFTDCDEKQEIGVRHDGLVPGVPSPWHEALPLFKTALAERIPSDVMETMLPGFSTETLESQIAGLTCFMDASSPYYSFMMCSACGIPSIRLLGEPEDYQRLVESAERLQELMGEPLARYFQHLIPVLKKIAEQAAGAPMDHDFWLSIYKDRSHSGSDSSYFSGWLSTFINYVHDNLRGSSVIKDKPANTYAWRDDERLNMRFVPPHVSRVPFVWRVGVAPMATDYPMELLGGVMGVDDVDGYVTPSLSYAVVHAAE